MFRFVRPRFFLTAAIFIAVLVMGARAADLWDVAVRGSDASIVTRAEAEAKDTHTDKAPADALASAKDRPDALASAKDNPDAHADNHPAPETTKMAANTAGGHGETGAPAVEVPGAQQQQEPAPAPQANYEYNSADLSKGEVEILKQLSQRRRQLDEREQEMQTRGALLQATEQRVDQKIREMEQLRTQLEGLITTVDEERVAELNNLVKIYESMKPAEAARILSNLDMSILLGVIRSMKPVKSAPILAEMTPERAKDITTALTESHTLPAVP
ncbi:MAG: hypothetical protein GC131_06185 [Alphaproteobacteria bacterium]|nr:hypothetical protein [Alphaproteobacteria bacterium]